MQIIFLWAIVFEDGFSRSFGCEFLLQDSSQGLYVNDISIINPNPQDVHSSNTLRTLKYYVDNGVDLPQSCRRALRQEKGILNFADHRCPLFNLEGTIRE